MTFQTTDEPPRVKTSKAILARKKGAKKKTQTLRKKETGSGRGGSTTSRPRAPR